MINYSRDLRDCDCLSGCICQVMLGCAAGTNNSCDFSGLKSQRFKDLVREHSRFSHRRLCDCHSYVEAQAGEVVTMSNDTGHTQKERGAWRVSNEQLNPQPPRRDA